MLKLKGTTWFIQLPPATSWHHRLSFIEKFILSVILYYLARYAIISQWFFFFFSELILKCEQYLKRQQAKTDAGCQSAWLFLLCHILAVWTGINDLQSQDFQVLFHFPLYLLLSLWLRVKLTALIKMIKIKTSTVHTFYSWEWFIR